MCYRLILQYPVDLYEFVVYIFAAKKWIYTVVLFVSGGSGGMEINRALFSQVQKISGNQWVCDQ